MRTFFNAWHFLCDHPCFKDEWGGENFESSLYIMVEKVNPETEKNEDDISLNTATRVWLECGPYVVEKDFKGTTHDIELDCGGASFEEAIIELADLVEKKYGTYEIEE